VYKLQYRLGPHWNSNFLKVPTKIKFLSFLNDKQKSCTLNSPFEKVLIAISNIPQTTGLWGDNNIILKSSKGNMVSIQLIRLGSNGRMPRLSSNLYGEVEKKNSTETIIQTKIKSCPGLYISFFKHHNRIYFLR